MDKLKSFAGRFDGPTVFLSPEKIKQMREAREKRLNSPSYRSIFEEFLEEHGDMCSARPYEPITSEEAAALDRHIIEVEEYIRSLPPCEYPSR